MESAGATGVTPELLTPEALIAKYCTREQESSWHRETRTYSEWYAGFIGWCGGDHGYDEGYEYMAALNNRGWQLMPEYGDWPYVIYLYWPAQAAFDKPCVAHYCEGDFAVEVFDSIGALREAIKTFPREGE